MRLTEISKAEFNTLPQSKKILCSEIEYSHKYAFVSVNENVEPILLCWRSELIEPEIINDVKSDLVWFGIDQQLIAINKFDGSVALKLNLDSNLLELMLFDNSIYLRAELEIYVFSLSGLVLKVYDLPEISKSLQIEGKFMRITMIDEQSIIIE